MLFVLCTVKWITKSIITNNCRGIKFIVKYAIYRTLHLLVLIEWVIKDSQFFSQLMYLEDIWIRMWVWNQHIIGLIILSFRELQFIFQFFSYSRRTQGWWQGAALAQSRYKLQTISYTVLDSTVLVMYTWYQDVSGYCLLSPGRRAVAIVTMLHLFYVLG